MWAEMFGPNMGMISLDLELQRNKILECLFDNFSLYYKVSTELKVQVFQTECILFFSSVLFRDCFPRCSYVDQ